jgi:hypothetical protein
MEAKKAEFLTELDAELIPGSDRVWKLEAPLIYWSVLLQRKIEVPAGFYTDYASVPRIPVIWLFWGGRAHREAALHDYLFRIDSDPVVSFTEANSIFLEAMQARGKSPGVRWPMYAGVSVGAYGYFHKLTVADRLLNER